MLNLILTAAAAAPAESALADLVLADPVPVGTELANRTSVKAAQASAVLCTAVPYTTVPFTAVPFTAVPFTAVPHTTVSSRVRPGAGTWLRCGGSAVLHDHATAQLAVAPPSPTAGQSLLARPQASRRAAAFDASIQAADQAEFAWRQRTEKKYTHPMTLIAPTGGGGLGPYPARDPV